MYAAEFDYYKAGSVAEALQLLGAHEGAKLIAGGHSLIPLLKLRLARPPALIDIGGIAELKGIKVENGTIHIGALATHGEIAGSSEIENACGMLAEAAGGIGDTQVRNWGTIGGNVVHADPASDWGTVLTAMNASFNIEGSGGLLRSGSRTVSAGDFFEGVYTTAVGEGEILTGIEMPVLGPNQHAEYAKMAHPATGFAVVGAAVVVTVADGRCTAASVVVGGMVTSPLRARSVESALIGQELNLETIAAASENIAQDVGDNAIGDFFASAEYRTVIAGVEVKHALNHSMGLAHH
ncbi:MAG: xanthine dehydrogenase family protein subunit M [Chloroflexi bacterium]|nr:xanthine dehydrogenase family protein subunit M [Chloroflexota bacterium]